MLSPGCFEYEFDRWPVPKYYTFKCISSFSLPVHSFIASLHSSLIGRTKMQGNDTREGNMDASSDLDVPYVEVGCIHLVNQSFSAENSCQQHLEMESNETEANR